MRTAMSFLPLLRPFIIKLHSHNNTFNTMFWASEWDQWAPVNQPLNNGHLRLLELLLGITSGGVRQVDSMADLDVIRQGDILHFDTTSKRFQLTRYVHCRCDRKQGALLCLPFAEKFDFLAEFWDVLGKGSDGGHFVWLSVLRRPRRVIRIEEKGRLGWPRPWMQFTISLKCAAWEMWRVCNQLYSYSHFKVEFFWRLQI